MSGRRVEKLPELHRLDPGLDVLPDEESMAPLEAVRGRDDYPVRAMWRAVAVVPTESAEILAACRPRPEPRAHRSPGRSTFRGSRLYKAPSVRPADA